MPTISKIRSAILEELVLVLLERAGYRILNESDGDEIRNGHSGLEIQGRGEWHQVDALASYDFTPAFVYPLRLIVEAKAYLPSGYRMGKVGIDVVRNAVGVLKDINENYFSHRVCKYEYKFRRFNYTYAVFSLYGFTKNAQRYAIAHQIFLIQYYYTPLFKGIRNILARINKQTGRKYFNNLNKFDLKDFRKMISDFLKTGDPGTLGKYFNGKGQNLMSKLRDKLEKINGSYFGLLNGEYPIHILSKKPIRGIEDRDVIEAKVSVNEIGYVKINFNNNELVFELPEDVAQVFAKVWDKNKAINLTRKYTSFITLSGEIDGIRRSIRIEFDESWLEKYLEVCYKKTNNRV